MTAGAKQAIWIAAVGMLVPAVCGVGQGFFVEGTGEFLLKNWIYGAIWIIGVFGGSIPLFFLKLIMFKKFLLVFCYLIVSFAIFAYSGLGIVCGVYDACF